MKDLMLSCLPIVAATILALATIKIVDSITAWLKDNKAMFWPVLLMILFIDLLILVYL